MKVGPTERIGLLSEAAPVERAAGAAASGAGAAVVPPFFAAGPFAASGRAIFFALSSVTMMSPCC